MLEKLEIKDKEQYRLFKVYDNRCFYVGNRVVASQSVYLLITGILTTLICSSEVLPFFFALWFLFLLVIPITLIILTYKVRFYLHNDYHWSLTLLLIGMGWCSITVFIGVAIDTMMGIGKTFAVSVFLCVCYVVGFTIAKSIRNIRFKYEKKSLLQGFFGIFLVIITITLVIGGTIYSIAVAENKIQSLYVDEYGEFLGNIYCAFGVFVMLSGVAVFVSVLLNYWMLFLLFEDKSWNVKEDYPNRLYIACLLRTAIWMLLFWIGMELLFPPVGRGKNGGSKGGHSSGSHYHSSSRVYRKHNTVEEEWEKDKLGVS